MHPPQATGKEESARTSRHGRERHPTRLRVPPNELLAHLVEEPRIAERFPGLWSRRIGDQSRGVAYAVIVDRQG